MDWGVALAEPLTVTTAGFLIAAVATDASAALLFTCASKTLGIQRPSAICTSPREQAVPHTGWCWPFNRE